MAVRSMPASSPEAFVAAVFPTPIRTVMVFPIAKMLACSIRSRTALVHADVGSSIPTWTKIRSPIAMTIAPWMPAKVSQGSAAAVFPTTTPTWTVRRTAEMLARPTRSSSSQECGCGVLDTDTDGDGLADCKDACPADPLKVVAGACGCSVVEVDTDLDGVFDCLDS